MFKFLILIIGAMALIGCAGMSPYYPGAIDTGTAVKAGSGIGFAGGVAAEKTKEAIKKSLTPVFPLQKTPIVVCSIEVESETANCTVVPCSLDETDPDYNKKCILKFHSLAEFIQFSPKFVPLDITALQVSAIINKCEKDAETQAKCVEYAGHYEGHTFVLTREK